MRKSFKFLAIALASSFALLSFVASDKKLILIDAGHGGNDCGAKSGSMTEKNIVMEIARKIQKENSSSNLKIVLLRSSDKFMTLQDRVRMINEMKPDAVISIHVDQEKEQTAKGIAAAVSPQNKFYDQSRKIAENLLQSAGGTGLAKGETTDGNFFLMKHSDCPAITLHFGNLSNENELSVITSEKGQTDLARAILKGLDK